MKITNNLIVIIILLINTGFSMVRDHFTYLGNDGNAELIQFNLGNPRISYSGESIKFDYAYTGVVLDAGVPELPLFSTLVQIEPGYNYSLSFNIIEGKIRKDLTIQNSGMSNLDERQSNESDNSINLFADNILLVDIVTISDPIVIRGNELIKINVTPFQFNPDNGELVINKEINIQLTKEEQREPLRNRKIPSNVRSDQFFNASVLNYSRTTEDYTPPLILFICRWNSIENPNFQQLADWKRKSGFEVVIGSVPEVGNSADEIKGFIQNAYDNWENPPMYVCIVGDINGPYEVPTFYEGLSWYVGEGDMPYTLLDGDDYYPDIFIGRITIDNSSEIATVVTKIMAYEKAYPVLLGQSNYFEKAALVGDPSSSGVSTIITNQYIEQIMELNSMENIQTNYGDGNYADWMSDQFNSGVLYINYRGYAGVSGFDNNDVNNLYNGFMLPVATMITCGTGFDGGYTNLSNKLLVAGSAVNPKGAVAAIGGSTYGQHTLYNNALDMGIYEGIFTYQVESVGEALNYGKINLLNIYYNQSASSEAAVYISHWYNLFGDPSLRIWTDTPVPFNVSFLPELPIGANFIEIHVSNGQNEPVENAVVTLLKDEDEFFKSDLTDAGGFVQLPLNVLTDGQVFVTVTKKNHIPFEGEFEIRSDLNAVYLNESQITITEAEGNGDGYINPGETIHLTLPVENLSNAILNNISGELTASSDQVTILNYLVSYGDEILPDEILPGSENYEIFISQSTDDMDEMELILQINDGNEIWQSSLELDIHGTLIHLDEVISGNGNQFLNSNGITEMSINLNNSGRISTGNLSGIVSTSHEQISILNGELTWGMVLPNNDIYNSITPLFLELNNNMITGSIAQFNLHLFDETGYEKSMDFDLQVGEVTVMDPLGPDSYGYYIYDSGDLEYDLAPFYNWIEIDPDYGGDGIDLDLNNVGEGNPGFQQSATIELPFNFTFYGIEYDSLTICTNGWISFGETEMTSFRNYNLPGAGGPSPMVAAFWDDLRTVYTGSVLTHYFPEESESDIGRFVIEWSDMRNYLENDEQDFQVILYDSADPNVDNDIKIQFKTYNNTSIGNAGWNINHGTYSTTGIENQDGLIGLEYTFNNEYPVSAMPLYDETALFITTKIGNIVPYYGDVNDDELINIVDVLIIVQFILTMEFTPEEQNIADWNQDGIVNVLDIIQIVNHILDP